MREIKPIVLVVEDEAAVRNLMATILRLSGFEVFHCADGAEALDLMALHGDSIQLLITDVHLGPISSGGVEMARGLLDRYRHLRVLYVSGLVDESEVDREVRAGRGHFIPKPFTPKTLISKVAAILDTRIRMASGDPVAD